MSLVDLPQNNIPFVGSDGRLTTYAQILLQKMAAAINDGEVDGLMVSESQRDAFGRVRVSDPLTLFDSQLQYNDGSLIYETVTVGGGSISHNPLESSVTLTIAAGGDSVIRQSRQYVRYKPGKSQLVKLTGVFGTVPTDDLIRRMGYFDDENGIFLQQDSNGLSFVRRSKTSGAVVDDSIAQASWNENTFTALDASKAFLMFIDMEWLGVGQARAGFYQNGLPVTAHIFNKVPSLTTPYIATANLPVRYEISSAANETGTMKQICAAVISEGGFEAELGIPQARDNNTGAAISTTEVPVMAIRPKATFGGITNRGTLIPESVDVFATANTVYRIYYNASITTGASWVSQGANSIAEYDISGTAFSTSGAELIDSGFIASGGGAKSGAADSDFTIRLPIVLDKSGANPVEFVITMQALSGTGTGYAACRWRELY